MLFLRGKESNQILNKILLLLLFFVQKFRVTGNFWSKSRRNSSTFTSLLLRVVYDSDGGVVIPLVNRSWLVNRWHCAYCCRCCFPMAIFSPICRCCYGDDPLWANLFWRNDDEWLAWSVERLPLFLDQNNCLECRPIHHDSLLWSLPTSKWSQSNRPNCMSNKEKKTRWKKNTLE